MFKNVRFPPAISAGAVGGPAFNTEVGATESGTEERNQNWDQELGSWEVSFDLRAPENWAQFPKFFRVVHGRGDSFRFQDHTDFEVKAGEGVFTMLTSTTFQCAKLYAFEGQTYLRKILLPRDPIVITGGSGPSINYTIASGVVTVASGTPTGWVGEFDCLARLDVDKMNMHVIDRGHDGLIIGWAGISIKELRRP